MSRGAVSDPVDSDELVEGLRQTRAHSGEPGTVELRETHVSWLFFAGDRVYKLKKPVQFAFLDASTIERRRQLCEQEVRLNRRLAPETYLGVLPVTRDEDGVIRIDGAGQVVDHVVAMRRLPAASMLDAMLARGEIDNQRLRELALLLAGFHEAAATGPGVDEHGAPEAVAELVLGNLDELRPFVGDGDDDVMSPAAHVHLRTWLAGFLRRHERLLAERVRRERIRDGHGDLHAANVCCTERGPVLYDCLEFSDRLRCADVAADLAFLAMDLDHRGFRAFSAYLVRAYVEASKDAGVGWLMDFYKVHRALVRAKVACLSSDASARDRARSYAALALTYTLPGALVLLCGLPASGKSWVARRLGPSLGAQVLRSDVVRKRLAGLAPTSHPREAEQAALYAEEHGLQTYRTLCRQAVDVLRRGRSVVVDATFASRDQRLRFIDVASRLGFAAVVLHVDCPQAVVRRRMEARRRDTREVSDADWSVYQAVAERFEPPDEQPADRLVHWDGSAGHEGCALAVAERIIAQTYRRRAGGPTES